MSHDEKSSSSREDTGVGSMLRIILLFAVTCTAGCIAENLALERKKNKNAQNNKMLFIVIIVALSSGLPRDMKWSLCKINSLLPFG